MKINEILGFGRDKESDLANFGKAAAKQWNLYKQQLARRNNFKPISAQDIRGHLGNFVRDNILVNYRFDDAQPTEKTAITAAMQKIMNNPDDVNQQNAAFTVIAQNAAKMGVKGAPGQQGNVTYMGGGKVCKDDTKKVGNTIYVCGKPINPGEKGYDEINKMIDGA